MEENLHSLQSILQNCQYNICHIINNPDKYYYSKIQPKMKFGRRQLNDKGETKLRYLTPPVLTLKIIQSEICNHLQAKQLPDCMFGSIEGSNNILNALQHIDKKFFLTIDLKSFFDNITSRQIHQTFMANNFSFSEATTLTKLTTFKACLPQGAPTSPVLANLAFAKTALQLENFIEKYKITFTTFLDDLTFSSTKDFKFLIPDLLTIIRSNNFYPHHKKIHYRKDYCEVTGLIVGNGKLRLTAQMQKEAVKNPRMIAYASNVRRQYNEYLERKRGKLKER